MREVNAGERLDQYELTELIARSGMASIFKAHDTVDNATVAIKVPYMQFESDIVFYNRFEREENVGLRLKHPSIVRVLAPKHKSRMYIAMEYVDGVSLRAVMHDNPRMEPAKALKLARQIAEARFAGHEITGADFPAGHGRKRFPDVVRGVMERGLDGDFRIMQPGGVNPHFGARGASAE